MALVYSKPGRRSGAHMNPVITLTFLRLGKIAPSDALGYVAGQFAGAVTAMALLAVTAGRWLGDPAVNYVRTVPGRNGPAVAFLAEAVISLGMMLVVLTVSNSRHRAYTGVCAGLLVASYITLEAPFSGMSMNPARTFGPAAVTASFDAIWVYFAAPLAGMLAGAEIYVRLRGRHAVACAKLHHDTTSRCLFRCGFVPGPGARPTAASGVPVPTVVRH
jgi:aquaporin Z